MDHNDMSFSGGDTSWASYITYPIAHNELPPNKRSKTSHQPPTVVCCDQPCPDDDVCFQNYCRDYCPDLCTDTFACTDRCHDPCQLPQCPEQMPYHQHAVCMEHCHNTFFHNPTMPCTEHCHDPCTQPCDFTAPDFCTLNHCIDPSTACMHECPDWCTSHCLTDCLDCLSSPSESDVHTPLQPRSLDHFHPTPVAAQAQLHHESKHAIAPRSTPKLPSPLQETKDYETPHVCRVHGCSAGCFKTEDALQDHIEKHHLNKLNGKYVCQWEGCIKKVTKKSNEHIEKEREARAKGQVYVPPAEPFSDDHLHKLKRHYYVHSGKKAFECDYPGCGSVHATKAQLKVHMARHNPKEFICDDCDKVFTTQNQLKTHINAVHKKQKHFRCPDCDYACDDSSNMSSHKRKQHQLGVPCPGHVDLGCPYRDGRQVEMEKHMRSCDHHVAMIDDKVFEGYWKNEKDNTDKMPDDSPPLAPTVESTPKKPKASSDKTKNRRQRKVVHRRKQSITKSDSSSRSSTVAEQTPLLEEIPEAPELLAGHASVGQL